MGNNYSDDAKEKGARVGQARKALKMTQQEFAERAGLTRGFLGQVECGASGMSERTINYICKLFSISKKWIETGEGDMFISKKKEETIASLFADVLQGDDNFKTKIVSGLARLSEEDWIVLEKLCDKVIGEDTEG